MDIKNVNTEILKTELERRGYQTFNLWHIADVKHKYKCDDDTAMDVLIDALENDCTMEQVNMAIDIVAEEKFELKPL
jgi:predicted glycosyltransferase involved in capsule biosynthesis